MATPGTAIRRTDFEETSAERARAALDAGDLDAARAAIDGIIAEEKPIHDLYGDMCASFLTFIAERLGEEAVEEAWRYVADDVWKPVLMHFKETGDLVKYGELIEPYEPAGKKTQKVKSDDKEKKR